MKINKLGLIRRGTKIIVPLLVLIDQ